MSACAHISAHRWGQEGTVRAGTGTREGEGGWPQGPHPMPPPWCSTPLTLLAVPDLGRRAGVWDGFAARLSHFPNISDESILGWPVKQLHSWWQVHLVLSEKSDSARQEGFVSSLTSGSPQACYRCPHPPPFLELTHSSSHFSVQSFRKGCTGGSDGKESVIYVLVTQEIKNMP